MLGSKGRSRLPRGAHLVDHGLVGCPVTGDDVAVETCSSCGRLESIEDDGPGTRPYVVCRGHSTGASGSSGTAPSWFTWG